VETGALLGRVGNTGYGPPGHRDEFPPHLHLGIQVGDAWIDPYQELVDLYDATVRETQQHQGDLDRLALAGDEAGWRELAATIYADFALPSGE
jgi:murein DD-endopeptidase MepM/ murein hydrolase activator NlpD